MGNFCLKTVPRGLCFLVSVGYLVQGTSAQLCLYFSLHPKPTLSNVRSFFPKSFPVQNIANFDSELQWELKPQLSLCLVSSPVNRSHVLYRPDEFFKLFCFVQHEKLPNTYYKKSGSSSTQLTRVKTLWMAFVHVFYSCSVEFSREYIWIYIFYTSPVSGISGYWLLLNWFHF